MNKERVKELQDHYMAFTSTSELEQIVISESVEVEAIEVARIELERRKPINLYVDDPRNERRESDKPIGNILLKAARINNPFPVIIVILFNCLLISPFQENCKDFECLGIILYPIGIIVHLVIIITFIILAKKFYRKEMRNKSITFTLAAFGLSFLLPVGFYFFLLL